MSEKESENQSWTDPKDFGLPYVEPIPLHPIPSTAQAETSSSLIPASTDITSIEQPSIQPELAEEKVHNREKQEKKYRRGRTKKKKSSKAWVWSVLILTLVAVGVISWQLILQDTDLLKFISNNEIENQPELLEETPEPQEQIIISEQNQPVDIQDTTTVTKDSLLVNSKPEETGTTIVNNNSGNNLIRIDSRAEKVRYFIVAASLPNEKLALEIIEKLSGKSPEFYLIYPFDSSPNYRVAVSKFDSWKKASDEAAKIRSQFSEDMWILTY